MRIGTDCIKCKGRLMCGLPRCPILERINIKNDIKIKNEFSSETQGVFIGWNGYPSVNAGLLAPYTNLQKQSPRNWVNKNSTIIDIMNYCSSLINSRSKVNIKELKGFNELIKNSSLSYKPLSVDVTIKKVPDYKINFDLHAQPRGPSCDIKKVVINDDPKMLSVVKKVHYDTDLKAVEAVNLLKKSKIEEYEISSLLSSGSIGVKRKLVPTRWSITATDDIITKEYINNIKNNEIIDTYQVFHGRHLGNIFTILLMPRIWSYELIEMWQPGAVFTNEQTQVMTDYEGFNSRKSYASNTGGGYYASRLPITEWLNNNKKQASAIVIRQITKDYYMPLGVWVVREAVRKAMQNQKRFSTYQLARDYVERITGFDLRRCKLISEQQTTLKNFKLN